MHCLCLQIRKFIQSVKLIRPVTFRLKHLQIDLCVCVTPHHFTITYTFYISHLEYCFQNSMFETETSWSCIAYYLGQICKLGHSGGLMSWILDSSLHVAQFFLFPCVWSPEDLKKKFKIISHYLPKTWHLIDLYKLIFVAHILLPIFRRHC